MRKRKFVTAVAVALGVALTATACSASGSGDDVIKIGTVHPLTGVNAGDGAQLENGAKLAVRDINAAGGIKALGGKELAIDPGDTKGSAKTGQSEAQRLVSGGAVALIGSYQSAVCANVAVVAERNKVPYLMDICGDNSILENGYKYTFRMQPPNSRFGASTADYVKAVAEQAHRPITKVAYLHENTAFGNGVSKAFAARAAEIGLTMGPSISYDAASVSDLTTQIAQVKSSGASILVISGYYRDGVLAAKAVQTVKPNLDAVVGAADGAFDQPQFPTDAGRAGNGYFDVNYHINDKSKKGQDFVKAYTAEYGDAPRTGAALAYDSVMVIAAAIEKAGSDDPEAIRNALGKTDVTPVVLSDGPVRFSETGENLSTLPVLTQVLDGAPHVVFPEQFATKQIVFPAGPGR
ncbi:ABC transporter substrate-binding protein [Gordonia humi]|uniref:Branched-chain amino acid transport system substrate-binding protein n=1 Tax=Gordonia humi TaxID=686429 RepID=A0A840F026_9ACTN|nr:ABC transporter substrate-binding protein [Gordonia humi]MBB4137221.1 branched-chain amino acid transport system substrate-binding protein [Gordonia humi]